MENPGSTFMSGSHIQRHYAELRTTREAEVLPHQIILLHKRPTVNDVVHIPGGQRIITGTNDGSIRVWDLESGEEIGDRWKVGDYPIAVKSLALSPNGLTLASGYKNGTMRLWDIGTGKSIINWTAHTHEIRSVCWSPDGERVMSGSRDGTARVWHGQSGEPVLGLNPMINLECNSVHTVAYSPDGMKIAAGGEEKNALNIWDARMGELLFTVEFQEERSYFILDDEDSTRNSGCIGQPIFSLVWALDGKKLICGFQCGWIRIFDTATWQEIAIIDLDRLHVRRVTLFPNNRLLASATMSDVRLWNLDTNLPVGPRLLHDDWPDCLAFSDDGKLVVGAGECVYVWDTHAIVKDAGSEDLMVISDKSFLDADATGLPTELEEEYQGRFFDNTPDGGYSPAPGYHNSSARHRRGPFKPLGSRSRVLFSRLSSLLRRSQINVNQTMEPQHPPRRSIFSRRGIHAVDVAAVRDKQALYVAPRPRINEKPRPHHGQSQSQAQASIPQTLPAASSPPTASPDPATVTAGAAGEAAESSPVVVTNEFPWWTRLVLFVCCASAQYTTRQ
ncbi:hypothetical protein CY34DRAFT_805883 [Suillus luteus UH-Slu-Lm8-n1]|uniref:WD40 repeat-like protein n=1 Tax=Suillus luteus UH-Slu-Lm8-n1 TaxID=930992 RepID=A0A0D0AUG3_9AGAM|nr:hypothetical protein CY34DRAFT_805883 [Suillus luteus UH-Slu-Lm8-n1]